MSERVVLFENKWVALTASVEDGEVQLVLARGGWESVAFLRGGLWHPYDGTEVEPSVLPSPILRAESELMWPGFDSSEAIMAADRFASSPAITALLVMES